MLSTLGLVQLIQCLFGKIYDNMSLKAVLIVPFVLQICITVGLVGYQYFLNGQQAIDKLANQLEVKINNKPWRDELGLNWLIVIVMPESNLMEQINTNIHNAPVLYFIAFVVTTYIGILTARWIGNPIMQLNFATKKIAKGRWELIPDECADVGELAKSFESMTHELQESFAALETINTDLQVLNTSLLASESRLYQFLEAMPMGVLVVEADGKPYYINQIGKQILLSDLVPLERIEDLAQLYQIYIAGTKQLYPSDINLIQLR